MAILLASGTAPGVAQETPSPAVRAAAERLQAAYATLLPEARALAGDVFLARRSEADARVAMAQAVRAALEDGDAASQRARFINDEDSVFGRCIEASKAHVGELALARAADVERIESARRAYFGALDSYVRGGANDHAFDLLGQLVAPNQGRTLSALADSLLEEALPRIDVPIPEPGGRGGDILPPRPWLPPVAGGADRHIGCYRDQSQRDLNGYSFNAEGRMTVDACLDTCRRRAFTYAGLQYAYFCFCGNSYGSYGNADNCDMRCHGNAQQICGGIWANSVYRVAAGGTEIGDRARLTVSNKEAKTYMTPFATARDTVYVIEVSGVISDWGDHPDGIDAVWCYAAWRCGPLGEVWQQLRIDGKGMNDIAGRTLPYNPAHTYRIEMRGTGRPFEFYAIDAQASGQDNSGAFEVLVSAKR
jgi:hypothetical protein